MNQLVPALRRALFDAAAGRGALFQRASARSAAFLRRRAAVLALSLTSVVAIALADLATGYELSLTLLYVAPVIASTWAFGLRAGLVLSVLATAAWVATDTYAEHHYSLSIYRYWECFIRLATFTLFAFIVDQLKRAIARSDDRLIKVLEGLDTAVCVIDPATGALLYSNRPFDTAFPQETSRDVADTFLAAALDDAAEELQVEGRWFLVRGRWLSWIDQRHVLLFSANDVTARRRVEALNREQEARLQATSRLVAVGEIASSIAHELNQPLAAIANYIQGCVRRLRAGTVDPEALTGALEEAGEQAERAAQIIRRVRDFVSSRRHVLAARDLNALVAPAVAAIAGEADRGGVQLTLHLAPGLPAVQADEVMIEQVILNLVRNAVEAVRDGNLRLSPIDIATARDGNMLRVTIADRGPGVAPEIMDRLFEPFCTSKAEGMGLGLSICRSIVEFHGGRLWTTPRAGGGTEFHFTLRTAETAA